MFCKKEIHGQTGLQERAGCQESLQESMSEVSWKNGVGTGPDWP